MITTAMLDALQDDELKATKTLIDEILHKRDRDRKTKALEQARAIDAEALEKKRAVLVIAGLTLKDFSGNGKKKAGKPAQYTAGRHYQNPANKGQVWNGRGQKPNWLRELETQGKQAVEMQVS